MLLVVYSGESMADEDLTTAALHYLTAAALHYQSVVSCIASLGKIKTQISKYISAKSISLLYHSQVENQKSESL